jgi:hypothetical protein
LDCGCTSDPPLAVVQQERHPHDVSRHQHYSTGEANGLVEVWVVEQFPQSPAGEKADRQDTNACDRFISKRDPAVIED